MLWCLAEWGVDVVSCVDYVVLIVVMVATCCCCDDCEHGELLEVF